MLHIILMILKILGILILSILGLALFIGLLVLFCPIRYYLEGSIYGKPDGQVRISWLLRLIHATISYKENRVACKICIFGIRLKKKKRKKEAQKKFQFFKNRRKNQVSKKEQEIKETEQAAKETEKKAEQEVKEAKKETEQAAKETREEAKLAAKENDKNQEQAEILQKTELEKDEEKARQKEKEHKNENENEHKNENENENENKNENKNEEKNENREKTKQINRKKDETKKLPIKIKEIFTKIKEILFKIKEFLIKIKEFLIKIKGIPNKIKNFLSAIKAKIQEFLALLKNLNKKKQTALAFIRDEKNKIAFRYAGGKLFRLLCYVLPRKVTLKLHYGFEDPATTGILTGMIFMFYPKSAEKFQLMPDFEKQVLEGEVVIKGRVRLIRVLCTAISIYFHKECNRIIKMILKR